MKYRAFGKTGFDISALGFGCMRLKEYEKDGKWYVDQDHTDEMLRKACDLGVNYFDTAYYYCHSNSEAAIGRALKPYRDKVKISTKVPMGKEMTKPGDYRRYLEESLRRLDTDRIDFYHFWGINKAVFDEKIIGMQVYKEAIRAKEEGLIRHISFSFHDAPENMGYIIDNGPFLESVLCQYNLLDRTNEKMIEYAAGKGLGVVVMGPVGGGRLSGSGGLSEKLTGKKVGANYELAFKYVLSNPHVGCALSGMETAAMVEQNAAAVDSGPLTADESAEINDAMQRLKKFSDLYCTGCNYCNVCPQNIEIPRVFGFYTMFNVYDLKREAVKSYNDFLSFSENTPDKCVECGLCAEKCPQKLEIPRLLKMVDGILRR